ncbi:B3 domain-containing protein LFL1 [Apostasia shenzhenica]|uniref:B3 domain-containing protein LFL1 n=1 Tax=Apostasia shenzhenica TaxID=1088818 RepID=A0A2I0AP29_9ASPA|nr:B3 domain-containing protein LFL1 [Apostasia shenzhenica]
MQQLMEGLRFLLQKELRNSDVSSLGRIVLPKRETESHLPVLTAREGISLPMQDLETSQLWSFKFRFWPNNKSRMYILESTAQFNGKLDSMFQVIRARKAGCQEQLLVDPMPVIEDGIFDSIIPDIVVARARYSDLYLPLAEGMNMALGMNCAFSADFSMSFLPDDGLGSSSSCMESLSLDDFY